MVGDAGEHVGKIVLRVEGVELGALDQRVEGSGAAATGIGAGKQIILAANGNRPVILPMSGGKLKFITGGTRCISVAFAANTLSGALAVKSFTLRWRPAWLSWWRPGCWIPPPAPGWSWVRRTLQCRRWLSCINY